MKIAMQKDTKYRDSTVEEIADLIRLAKGKQLSKDEFIALLAQVQMKKD